MAEQQLNIYSTFQFNSTYHHLPAETKRLVREEIAKVADTTGEKAYFYSVYPARYEFDFMIWSAIRGEEEEMPGKSKEFLTKNSFLWEELRRYIEPKVTLWGYTRPSMYARGKTEQDIEAFSGERSTFLVVYPFSKTADWYLKAMGIRQSMMNEHIKLGKQFPAIKQLLLYSFGLQDQEFVVSYETEDLSLFSRLVQDLRSTDARIYTQLDTPIITGTYLTHEAFIR